MRIGCCWEKNNPLTSVGRLRINAADVVGWAVGRIRLLRRASEPSDRLRPCFAVPPSSPTASGATLYLKSETQATESAIFCRSPARSASV